MTSKEKEKLNHFLVYVFHEILKTEEKSISSKISSNLSLRDIHTLEAICLANEPGGDNSSAAIASALHVTPGTLTTAVSSLERKGYLTRSKDPSDKRIVRITATEKGVAAQERHDAFHHEMIDGILATLTEEEAQIFCRSLEKLGTFFHEKYLSPAPNNMEEK